MLDPQEVRKRRQTLKQQLQVERQDRIREEAQKIFQWILRLIDEDTKRRRCNSITIWKCDDSNTIDAGSDHYELRIFSRNEIFPIVCEIINSEEGYHAEYNEDTAYYDENAWSLTVSID